MPKISGVQAVFQTPFHPNGAVDEATLEREIHWIFDQGADGVVFAMVSEILRLSSEERELVTRVVARAAQGRGDCVIGVGAESVEVARRYAASAEEAGATAIMATPPAVFRASEAALLDYYGTLIASCSLPVVVQDASGYVGAPLSLDLQLQLLDEFGERVYFKPEAPPIGPRVSTLRAGSQGRAWIFEGTGGLHLIDSHRRGVIGTMPAGDMVWALVAIWRALGRGDEDAAYSVAARLAPVIALQFSLDAFVAIEKHNLVRQGVFATTVMRGPLGLVADDQTMAEVDRLVDRLRVAVEAAG